MLEEKLYSCSQLWLENTQIYKILSVWLHAFLSVCLSVFENSFKQFLLHVFLLLKKYAFLQTKKELAVRQFNFSYALFTGRRRCIWRRSLTVRSVHCWAGMPARGTVGGPWWSGMGGSHWLEWWGGTVSNLKTDIIMWPNDFTMSYKLGYILYNNFSSFS